MYQASRWQHRHQATLGSYPGRSSCWDRNAQHSGGRPDTVCLPACSPWLELRRCRWLRLGSPRLTGHRPVDSPTQAQRMRCQAWDDSNETQVTSSQVTSNWSGNLAPIRWPGPPGRWDRPGGRRRDARRVLPYRHDDYLSLPPPSEGGRGRYGGL